MKRLVISLILMAVLVITLFATPALAFDPPDQGSDNATDVIIWHGDNLTIEAATITIDDLQEAMVAAAEAQAEALNESNSDIANQYFILFVVALLIALVFWQRSIFMYAVGTPTAIVYGLSLARPENELSWWVAGVVIALIGTYFLYQIIAIAFEWARGKRAKE